MRKYKYDNFGNDLASELGQKVRCTRCLGPSSIRKQDGGAVNKELPYDMYIHWQLLRECNFSCEYCYSSPQTGPAKKADVARIVHRLDAFGKTSLISFTGGEPFLVPNFIELVKELTKRHYVRIDTNLSLLAACESFIKEVDPERICEIVFSIHAGEREKRKMPLRDLCALVRKFRDRGFIMTGNYVVYPTLLKRFSDDMKIFRENAVSVLPSLFVGRQGGKNYPMHAGRLAYEQNAFDLISGINPKVNLVLNRSVGELCPAGVNSFFVNSDYKVFACAAIRREIGDFWGDWKMFPKVVRCPMEYCYCPFNKPFVVGQRTQIQTSLLKDALHRNGEASVWQSRFLTRDMRRGVKRFVERLVEKFSLRE